jgi:hypothetical protein
METMATKADQHIAPKADASNATLIERAKEIDPSAWRGDDRDDTHDRRMAAIQKALQEQAAQAPADIRPGDVEVSR